MNFAPVKLIFRSYIQFNTYTASFYALTLFEVHNCTCRKCFFAPFLHFIQYFNYTINGKVCQIKNLRKNLYKTHKNPSFPHKNYRKLHYCKPCTNAV